MVGLNVGGTVGVRVGINVGITVGVNVGVAVGIGQQIYVTSIRRDNPHAVEPTAEVKTTVSVDVVGVYLSAQDS